MAQLSRLPPICSPAALLHCEGRACSACAGAAQACAAGLLGQHACGRPDIRSRLQLGTPAACTASTARRASATSCARPHSASSSSWKACAGGVHSKSAHAQRSDACTGAHSRAARGVLPVCSSPQPELPDTAVAARTGTNGHGSGGTATVAWHLCTPHHSKSPHARPHMHTRTQRATGAAPSARTWTPTLTRVTPMPMYALSRAASKVPGSASIDTSAPAASPNCLSRAASSCSSRGSEMREGVPAGTGRPGGRRGRSGVASAGWRAGRPVQQQPSCHQAAGDCFCRPGNVERASSSMEARRNG